MIYKTSVTLLRFLIFPDANVINLPGNRFALVDMRQEIF